MLKNRLTWFGLIPRLLLIFSVIPLVRKTDFIPFLQSFFLHPSFNIWQAYLTLHPQHLTAFPYGVAMASLLILSSLVMSPLLLVTNKIIWLNISIGFCLLLFDYLLLKLLLCFTEKKQHKLVFYFYWLSPLVIYITYWHGQLDLIPVFFMMLALYELENEHPILSGFALAFAISAKLSMLITVPIILIYLFRNKKVEHLFSPFLTSLCISEFVLSFPFLFSKAYYEMVLFNPQMMKITAATLNYNHLLHIYLLPVIFILFLYYVWTTVRLNQHLLYSLIGIAFAILLVFTPASIGWYLWLIPFWILYLTRTDSLNEKRLYILATLLFLLYGILFFELQFNNHFLQSASLTGLAIILCLIAIQMYQRGIYKNDYFLFTRKPLAIGIAGNSGSGKDTLAAAIYNLFPSTAVTNISGDDYHKWDRYSPMWQSMTHLNPLANNLYQYAEDVLALIKGKSILTRHYNHKTGRFSRHFSVTKKDVVIASGLHVLFSKKLIDILDVKVFLAMDENLRQFLKIRRDVLHRKHSLEKAKSFITQRHSDSARYIEEQCNKADIIFKLKPLNVLPTNSLDDLNQSDIAMSLDIELKHAGYYDDLTRFLISYCNCFAKVNIHSNQKIQLEIFGQPNQEDIKLAAQLLLPEMQDVLAIRPKWENGFLGLMQLIVLLESIENIKLRKLS